MISGVEFEHGDVYGDREHVKSWFRGRVAQMGNDRVLAVCADFPHALDVSKDAKARRLTFGLTGGDFRATDLRIDPDGAHFSIARDGKPVASEMHLPIGGRMNVANALGVYVLLSEFGVSADEIAGGLRSFSGVARRQEIIGEAAGVTVGDDFAHHPTAIRATLEAIAERFAGRRILPAFDPRSNTPRRPVFHPALTAAVDRAKRG